MSNTFFPAKLLLFGEYTVLLGSQALAMPLLKFGGQWAYTTDWDKQLDLPKFNVYLKTLVENNEIALDTEGVADDLKRGLFFDSDIPRGYGAGSSGALVAALYGQYGLDKLLTINDLKIVLGKMESYFHGASSGFDPLISFVRKPVLIKEDKSLVVLEAVKNDLSIFLLDTKQPRKTEPLVKIFMDKCKQTPLRKDSFGQYSSQISDELVPYVNDAISSFLGNKTDLLFDAIHNISYFQYRFFAEMIPLAFKNIWLEGLSSAAFKLKLCGAGGGGFILGFAKEKERTTAILSKMGYAPTTIWL